MHSNRRGFLAGGLTAAAGLLGGAGYAGAKPNLQLSDDRAPGGADAPIPVVTPDIPMLGYELDGDVKVFRLRAEVVKRGFVPGRNFDVWGYNGTCPGPTIEVNQGDRVRLIVENRLPEPTSMHWHGFEIPIDQDGVPGVTQDLIPSGGTYTYEFTLHQHGTYFYHSHMAMQEMMGMIGLFIMHPREAYEPVVDKDYGLILQEWSLLPNSSVPNSLSMEFNWLTINGRAGPHTTPLIAKVGERVRIRVVNLGMDHHPIHLHGNTFNVTAKDGGRVPTAARVSENTVLVGVAQSRDVEFEAEYPGDWMLHCHLPHHMMNQMVSMVGPMAEMGHGMQTSMSMGAGMGMVSGGALGDENGPAMGRGIGVNREQATSALVGRASATRQDAVGAPTAERVARPVGMAQNPGMAQRPGMAPMVRGFPQDMFMAMDAMVAKPETYGLRPTWSGGVVGMMTLVRVLPEELYDEVKRRQAEARVVELPRGPR